MNDSRNMYEQIKAPPNMDIVIKKAINKGIKYKIYKKSSSVIATISVLMLCILVTAYASPVVAETLSQIPVIGTIFAHFTDDGLKKISNKGLTQVSDYQVTKNDETVAVKEIYYDKSRISLGLAIKGKTLFENGLEYLFYHNGELLPTSFYGGISQVSDDIRYFALSSQTLPVLPDKFNLKLVVKERIGEKRVFEFNLPMNRSNVDQKTKEFTIMKTFYSKDRVILIKNIIFSPSATTINYEYTRPVNETEYALLLKDQKNNIIKTISIGGQSKILDKYRIETASATFDSTDLVPEKLTFNILEFIDQKDIILEAQLDIKTK